MAPGEARGLAWKIVRRRELTVIHPVGEYADRHGEADVHEQDEQPAKHVEAHRARAPENVRFCPLAAWTALSISGAARFALTPEPIDKSRAFLSPLSPAFHKYGDVF